VSFVVPDILTFSIGTNPFEDRIRYHQYDDYGNPSEISRERDTRVSFLWGYTGQLLIAPLDNALNNEIFHASFADKGGNSNTDDSRIGRYSSITGFRKQLTGLTSNKEYVLTYWEKGPINGKRSLKTLAVGPNPSTTFDINLPDQVEEICFAPQNAMMTTYTHRSGAGILSATDVNNRSVIYEYDPFNRLRLIKDDQGQILKTFQYNYKQ
jgi:hypothetical protein